jgi:hypothetical protein
MVIPEIEEHPLDGDALPEHEPALSDPERYCMPEPGDENLSAFALDCKYHVPFEGTVFEIRKDPDPAILQYRRRKKAMQTNLD